MSERNLRHYDRAFQRLTSQTAGSGSAESDRPARAEPAARGLPETRDTRSDPRPGGREEVNCAACGITFLAYRLERRKFCGLACRREVRGRARVELACAECGRTFTAPRSQNRKYCGAACNAAARWKGPTALTCANCGAPFQAPAYENRKVCSTSCGAALARRARLSGERRGAGQTRPVSLSAPASDLRSLPIESLIATLVSVPKRREFRDIKYPFARALACYVVAMIDGARTLDAIERWGWEHGPAALTEAFGWKPRKQTPSAKFLGRLLQRLDRPAFEHALVSWVRGQGMPAEAIDRWDGTEWRNTRWQPLPGWTTIESYRRWRAQQPSHAPAPDPHSVAGTS